MCTDISQTKAFCNSCFERIAGYPSETGKTGAPIFFYLLNLRYSKRNTITPGFVSAIHLMIQAFASPVQKVLVQQPVYYPFFSAIKINRCRIVSNSLVLSDGTYQMDFEDLERKTADPDLTLVILCSPHNPVARVWSRTELETFGGICRKNNVLVISDEIHGGLICPGTTFTSWGTLENDLAENAIICTAQSNTFNLAGLQTSNIIIQAPEIRRRFALETKAALPETGPEHLKIDQHKQAEKAQMESEEKYKNLFESSIDAILLFNPEKGFIDCNPAAFDLFKIDSKEQLMQLTPTALSPKFQPDGTLSSERAENMIKETEQKGLNILEWTHKKLNGEEFSASVIATKIIINEQSVHQITIRDITEYKRTQEMIIQSEKMLSVGGLAAGMAHEINNPLAGMMQNANVIKSRLDGVDMPANLKVAEELGIAMEDITAFMEKRNIFRMLDAIHESGARAAEIVNSMLNFARKTASAISFHYPDQLMDKILELAATDYDLKKQYDFKSIEIIKEYAENLPMLPCEGAKIQQVLLNIIRNGAQAMQAAKTESPRFLLRIYSKGEPEMVHMEIEDNGPDMDEQTRSKVFDPFFTTKPVGVGTGLGLSVSYFIITENHRGTMDVVSEPGKGVNFIVRLPVDRKN